MSTSNTEYQNEQRILSLMALYTQYRWYVTSHCDVSDTQSFPVCKTNSQPIPQVFTPKTSRVYFLGIIFVLEKHLYVSQRPEMSII